MQRDIKALQRECPSALLWNLSKISEANWTGVIKALFKPFSALLRVSLPSPATLSFPRALKSFCRPFFVPSISCSFSSLLGGLIWESKCGEVSYTCWCICWFSNSCRDYSPRLCEFIFTWISHDSRVFLPSQAAFTRFWTAIPTTKPLIRCLSNTADDAKRPTDLGSNAEGNLSWYMSPRLQWHRLQWLSNNLPSYGYTFLCPQLDLRAIKGFGYS